MKLSELFLKILHNAGNPIVEYVLHRERYRATLIIGFAQIVLGMLAVADRLNITVPSSIRTFNAATEDTFWGAIFFVVGMFTIFGVKFASMRSVAMSMSASSLGTWGLIQFMVAVSAIRPVSYAGPVLSIFMSWLAIVMAGVWSKLYIQEQLQLKEPL